MGKLTDFLGGISPLLGGIGNVASTMIQSNINRQSQDAQNKANMELAKYQYNTQLDLYNKANIYNSPAEQMKRFKDAGLNPNLIYGQGNSGNTPNILPQYHSPDVSAKRFSPVNPSDIISSAMSAMLMSENIKQAKADRRLKEQNALKAEAGQPYYSDNAYYATNTLKGTMFQNELKSLLAQWERDSLSNKSRNYYYLKPEVSQLWGSHLLGKYGQNEAKLNAYNSSIALNNARKDLLDLDIVNYVPKWLMGLAGIGGSALKSVSGVFKAKVPKGYVQTGKNLGGGSYETLRKSIY